MSLTYLIHNLRQLTLLPTDVNTTTKQKRVPGMFLAQPAEIIV